MSFNFERRVYRAQCRIMIEEFKKEANLTRKQLDGALAYYSKSKVSGLNDRFKKMINLALGKYNKAPEVEIAPVEPTETEIPDVVETVTAPQNAEV